MNLLELAIRKKLKHFELEIELNLPAGEGHVVVLFGPSGSGKTMTLKCIAGVTEPDAGYIAIGGKPVYDSNRRVNLAIQQRRVGYLPQNYALFPHLTVAENISFGLLNHNKEQAAGRVSALTNQMKLNGLEKLHPRQLSGGQQQRVAFARALAPEPDILLLDEPFSALDAGIRAELRQNLAMLSRDLSVPVVFITHDLEEAYMLADRMAVIDRGKVLQYGPREEIFYRPASEQVARLIGIHNLWPGKVLEVAPEIRMALVRTNLLDIRAEIPGDRDLPQAGDSITVCVRPESIRLNRAGMSEGLNRFSGQVINVLDRGSLCTLHFVPGTAHDLPTVGSGPANLLELEIPSQVYNGLRQLDGEGWQIEIPPDRVHLL